MGSEAEATRWHLHQERIVLRIPVAADSGEDPLVKSEEAEDSQAIRQGSFLNLVKIAKKEESSDEDTQVKIEQIEEGAVGPQAARQPLKRSRTLALPAM